MRLHQLPETCIALLMFMSSRTNAQFSYPPPLERPLTDYTSGAATSALNFSDGDNMFGGWTTPGRLESFLLYRCTHTPSSKPIYPSNSSFVSRDGKLASDGTWEQMPLYEGADNAFGNGFNPGSNPIWFQGDFFAPNETTGTLCWFELYPGSDSMTYENGTERVATVDGSGDWYFATVPFVVKPKRPSGLTVTWKSDGTERGKPTSNVLGNKTDAATLSHEFPSTSTSSSADSSSSPSNGGAALCPSRAGIVLGSLLTLWLSTK